MKEMSLLKGKGASLGSHYITVFLAIVIKCLIKAICGEGLNPITAGTAWCQEHEVAGQLVRFRHQYGNKGMKDPDWLVVLLFPISPRLQTMG